eukprot:352334-Rhodomonas_salina.2
MEGGEGVTSVVGLSAAEIEVGESKGRSGRGLDAEVRGELNGAHGASRRFDAVASESGKNDEERTDREDGVSSCEEEEEEEISRGLQGMRAGSLDQCENELLQHRNPA